MAIIGIDINKNNLLPLHLCTKLDNFCQNKVKIDIIIELIYQKIFLKNLIQ